MSDDEIRALIRRLCPSWTLKSELFERALARRRDPKRGYGDPMSAEDAYRVTKNPYDP